MSSAGETNSNDSSGGSKGAARRPFGQKRTWIPPALEAVRRLRKPSREAEPPAEAEAAPAPEAVYSEPRPPSFTAIDVVPWKLRKSKEGGSPAGSPEAIFAPATSEPIHSTPPSFTASDVAPWRLRRSSKEGDSPASAPEAAPASVSPMATSESASKPPSESASKPPSFSSASDVEMTGGDAPVPSPAEAHPSSTTSPLTLPAACPVELVPSPAVVMLSPESPEPPEPAPAPPARSVAVAVIANPLGTPAFGAPPEPPPRSTPSPRGASSSPPSSPPSSASSSDGDSVGDVISAQQLWLRRIEAEPQHAEAEVEMEVEVGAVVVHPSPSPTPALAAPHSISSTKRLSPVPVGHAVQLETALESSQRQVYKLERDLSFMRREHRRSADRAPPTPARGLSIAEDREVAEAREMAFAAQQQAWQAELYLKLRTDLVAAVGHASIEAATATQIQLATVAEGAAPGPAAGAGGGSLASTADVSDVSGAIVEALSTRLEQTEERLASSGAGGRTREIEVLLHRALAIGAEEAKHAKAAAEAAAAAATAARQAAAAATAAAQAAQALSNQVALPPPRAPLLLEASVGLVGWLVGTGDRDVDGGPPAIPPALGPPPPKSPEVVDVSTGRVPRTVGAWLPSRIATLLSWRDDVHTCEHAKSLASPPEVSAPPPSMPIPPAPAPPAPAHLPAPPPLTPARSKSASAKDMPALLDEIRLASSSTLRKVSLTDPSPNGGRSRKGGMPAARPTPEPMRRGGPGLVDGLAEAIARRRSSMSMLSFERVSDDEWDDDSPASQRPTTRGRTPVAPLQASVAAPFAVVAAADAYKASPPRTLACVDESSGLAEDAGSSPEDAPLLQPLPQRAPPPRKRSSSSTHRHHLTDPPPQPAASALPAAASASPDRCDSLVVRAAVAEVTQAEMRAAEAEEDAAAAIKEAHAAEEAALAAEAEAHVANELAVKAGEGGAPVVGRMRVRVWAHAAYAWSSDSMVMIAIALLLCGRVLFLELSSSSGHLLPRTSIACV